MGPLTTQKRKFFPKRKIFFNKKKEKDSGPKGRFSNWIKGRKKKKDLQVSFPFCSKKSSRSSSSSSSGSGGSSSSRRRRRRSNGEKERKKRKKQNQPIREENSLVTLSKEFQLFCLFVLFFFCFLSFSEKHWEPEQKRKVLVGIPGGESIAQGPGG